jgi:hypothetical protein
MGLAYFLHVTAVQSQGEFASMLSLVSLYVANSTASLLWDNAKHGEHYVWTFDWVRKIVFCPWKQVPHTE